jgi:hypothetical protein
MVQGRSEDPTTQRQVQAKIFEAEVKVWTDVLFNEDVLEPNLYRRVLKFERSLRWNRLFGSGRLKVMLASERHVYTDVYNFMLACSIPVALSVLLSTLVGS